MACECEKCETLGGPAQPGPQKMLPDVIAARVLELVQPNCTDQELMAAIQTAGNEYNTREQAKYTALLRAELWAKKE